MGLEAPLIRPFRSLDEFHACEQLQKHAWDFDGDLDVIPLTQLIASQKAGGILLGAFECDSTLVGFCYGFPGLGKGRRLLHYSHMLAVHDRYRSSGVGARLKWAQRDAALAQGIELMVWTFDPLESLNSYFNLEKLGVVCTSYWRNMYGETTSRLHRGTPTDRFVAEWHLASDRVTNRERGSAASYDLSDAVRVLECRHDGELQRPAAARYDSDEALLACEIPTSIQSVKAADPEVAREWRMSTRSVLESYLGRGYHVSGCVRASEPARTVFVLEAGGYDPVLPPSKATE